MSSVSSSGSRGRGRGGRGRGRGSGPSGPPSRASGRGGPSVPPIDRTGVPRGICTFYWSTGVCNRSFDCTFKHDARPGVQDSSSTTQPTDYTPDFFSLEGLAINNGSVIDTQHSLRPSEAHNHLRPYLFDNFVFRDAINAEGFSRILASVNSRNRAWDSSQAQAFLDTIVRGNALLRIGDVLRFSPVEVDVGAGSSKLSFQKGYFPVLEFLSSDLVLKTTMHQNTNKIYSLIDQNYDEFQTTTRRCMALMIEAKTWDDRSPGLPVSRRNTFAGVIVFKTLSAVLSQYLSRFKHAIQNHPELHDFVEDLVLWFSRWATGVQASPPAFADPISSAQSSPEVRNLTLAELEKEISRLRLITDREYGHAERMRRPVAHALVTADQMQQAFTSRLINTYEPPGTLRDGGMPRHDNDFTDICDIRIAPTHEELLCPLPPYLPVFLPTAPHHLPVNSMQRHLDIQFRLLREEMVASIRQSIGEISRDLEIIWAPRVGSKQHATTLEKLLANKGGAYKTSGLNSVFFHLYTGARFAPLKAERRNFTVGLILDTPPGAPRDPSGKRRAEYWEHSKRLQHGSLVALILISPGRLQVFLGTIISMGADIAESAKADAKTIQLRISFFDAEIELMALRRQPISINKSTCAVLLDNNIMFESLHPFLRTLQNVEPTFIPFSNLLSYSGRLDSLPVEPPRYARVPWFKYNLQCLARSGMDIPTLDVNDEASVAIAHQQLLHSSDLDPSQVNALVDALTREVCLIQGPPGTGKSFTGKEILRVLFSSGIKPIVVIAFTNHALDHLLTSILDAQITANIVRLGSRTTDERVAQYSLHKLEQLSGRGDLDRPLRREYAVLKKVEDDMTRVMNQIQLPKLAWEDAEKFLDFHYPQHADSLREPPYWVAEVFRRVAEDENENGEWTQVSRSKKSTQDPEIAGIYGFWKSGRDIEFIQPPSESSRPGHNSGEDLRQTFFNELGFSGRIPPIPSGRRTLERLFESTGNVWSMSLSERKCLAEAWEEDMRTISYESNLQEFDLLKERYKDACKVYEDVHDEVRRRLLSRTDLIACTTTGAAKLVSLLTSIGPKVILVEEAGQVLEAHILASLVPSVEHLICIGDPKQLRPNVSTFSLTMDSPSGMELFKFDRSLMERLSDMGMSMSQINVQRRMRPTISHFARTILYPKLEDHNIVRRYPSVQGVDKNVFFFSHNNAENAETDSVSKYNMFEVAMIRDLVLYFLKQGPYDGAGDIAVLCAYLGQLQKVRAALRDLKIAVSIDERDEEELERTGLAGDDEIGFAQVQVARHIRIGTVDTFQGQEAKIVIISLVRNSGSFEEGQGSIGFLKSPNRINVALSRAKHGMYILGNASNLRKNETWRTVLDEMENEDQIGYAFPIVCPRHPIIKRFVSKPGELPMLAPEGGCLRPCEYRLSCGHVCPSMCHTDQDNHRRMKCNQPCLRLACPRVHPCPLLCSEDCGDCQFPIYDVKLPCGHKAKSVPCHILENLKAVKCVAQTSKRLPGCEHSATMACGRDPATGTCKETCGGLTKCCSRRCTSRCHECQKVTKEKTAGGVRPSVRAYHRDHPCERLLKCQHLCGLPCSSDHSCNPKCPQGCRQRCSHRKCDKPCWEPCPPCMEPCEWRCPHHECPVVCGSICSRLPCDIMCKQKLTCGHECPSVCGEPCDEQACILCLPEERKVDIVDFIMQRTLAEIDLNSEDISERLIKLACGHIFTVETLDGHCNMSEYYEIDPMGIFTATKAPPVSYQNPPSCPTCRGPITALRYGRVTKRANLDILEQNVASTMSSALEKISPQIEEISAKLESAKDEAKKIPFSPPASGVEDFDRLAENRRTRFGKESEPLPHDVIHQSGMTTVHGFSGEETRAWNKIVRDLLKLYKRLAEVAGTRGPHIQSYHAALATLYRLELAAIASDPARACDKPEPLAINTVNKKIGQPPHKADTRFQVEAFFLSLELRYTLAEIAQSRIEGLNTDSQEDITMHVQLWRSYVSFIFESCIRDAEKALSIAQKSTASRAEVYILRGRLELFRFEILTERALLIRERLLDITRRKELSAKAQKEAIVTATRVKTLEAAYIRNRPVEDMEELKTERAWFGKNCREKGDKYVEEYNKLANYILTESIYEPVSLQEKADIVKAFGFSHRGHFYNCENGHTFVITECGGAMESARCPECRAPIGGSSHRLDNSNTRATEFEEIARHHGSRDSPWQWGREA